LFERLSRGVKLSTAGKLFLEEARRILLQVDEATRRAKRVASGQSGILRVGFVESMSWHGVVPDSFRQFRERQPDAELRIKPLSSLEQFEAVQSETVGCRIRGERAATTGGGRVCEAVMGCRRISSCRLNRSPAMPGSRDESEASLPKLLHFLSGAGFLTSISWLLTPGFCLLSASICG
jgi:DNA-binding transcriptional LysR family regulator